MSISAQPAYIGSKPLKPLFDALGLSGPNMIRMGSDSNSAMQDAEKLDLKPGERSLKARVMTLIDNNKPNIAMDLMQKTSHDDPDLFDAIADEVYEELKYNGYEKDAEELKRMTTEPSFEDRPKADYETAMSALTCG